MSRRGPVRALLVLGAVLRVGGALVFGCFCAFIIYIGLYIWWHLWFDH